MSADQCHLCNNKLFPDPILSLNGMPKAAQYYPNEAEFGEDKGLVLSIYQCTGCGLVQLKQKPVDYFREVITAASLSEKSRLSRLNQMKEFAAKFGLQGKKILDIGSGKGEMVNVLEEAGMVAAGLEASAESVEIGRAAGRRMIQGYIGDSQQIEGAPFDAFISLNYLEHLPDPGRIIQIIHQQTSKNAVGYVTVPNLDYLLKTRCFYEFVADHLSYFTQKTLTCAFEMNGFDVIDCRLINEENDIAAIVKKREILDLSQHYGEVESVINDLKKIMQEHKAKNKKIAVWGAGHRTLALLALSNATGIEYVVDSAKFKQGKFTPVVHLKIVSPDMLKENKVDLVIIMVPGLYPEEVCKNLDAMNLGIEKAVLQDNKIEFIR